MTFLAWMVLGLISGFMASNIVNQTGEGAIVDIVLGIVGVVVGGWPFNAFGHLGVTGVNLYSMHVAVVGAITVLVIYRAPFVRAPAPAFRNRLGVSLLRGRLILR